MSEPVAAAPAPVVVAAPVAAPAPVPVVAPAPVEEAKPAAVGADSLLATAHGDKPEGEAAKEGEAPKEAAPEGAVEYEFKLPEGFQADDAVVGTFKEKAKELGLSQEAAQSLVDLHFEQVKTGAEAFAKEQLDTWKETIDGWKAELAKDPAFSGDKAIEAQTVIGRALDEYGTPEAREAFAFTGAGHNPAIIKMIHKMALALDEGSPVPAGKPAAGLKTPGELFYGNQEGT